MRRISAVVAFLFPEKAFNPALNRFALPLGRRSGSAKDPRYKYGDDVKNNHRRGKQQHIRNIVSGRKHSGSNQYDYEGRFPDFD
jgi:hypothetical protein